MAVVTLVTLVVGAVGIALLRIGHGDGAGEGAQPVHGEAILCAEVHAVPAEASSDGLQCAPGVEVAQDPRCEELQQSAPGEVALRAHAERDEAVGRFVLAGELRFDDDARCFYVVADGEPVGILWPARFTGKANPPRIAVTGGNTVLGVGDRFEVRGRYVSGIGEDCGPVGADSVGFLAGGEVLLLDR